jgi:SsrA-binding protein
MEIKNRKAQHEYNFKQSLEAGIMLDGAEVKSIREGNANLNDAFCYFRDGALYIRNFHVAPFKQASGWALHDPLRERKLLLKKNELKKLKNRVEEKGMSIVPYRLYLSDRGLIKMEIVLAEGKKSYDKRETIKAKDNRREMERMDKNVRN